MILAESMVITASRSLSDEIFKFFTVTLPVRTEESTLTPGGQNLQWHQQPKTHKKHKD